MRQRMSLLLGLLCVLSCSSVPPDCGAIRSERWPVEHSWLLKQLEPSSIKPEYPAYAELLNRYREGDQIWSYRAPEPPPRDPARPDLTGKYAYEGYVLLRGCEAVYVIPSNRF